jgi:hypothetical protein
MSALISGAITFHMAKFCLRLQEHRQGIEAFFGPFSFALGSVFLTLLSQAGT